MSAYSEYIYVGFCMDDGPHWWSRFLHPQIKHCYVVVPSCDGGWIGYSKTRIGMDTMIAEDPKDIVGDDLLIKSKVVRGKRGLFMLNTCVGHTKQMLGISNPFIWTPYQLYKHLRKRNDRLT